MSDLQSAHLFKESRRVGIDVDGKRPVWMVYETWVPAGIIDNDEWEAMDMFERSQFLNARTVDLEVDSE